MVKIFFTLKSDFGKYFHDKKFEVYKGFSVSNLNIFPFEQFPKWS